MSFFENTRKPVGFGGKIMVAMMNVGHSAVARWGLQFLNAAPDARVLDCGCGGGANIKRLLKKCPQGIVKGIDYSPVSVEKSKKVNETAIVEGRCTVLQGSVADMMFADNWFDAVTAFETVYFWPDLPQCFREVYRVLKPGGTLLICNESNGDIGAVLTLLAAQLVIPALPYLLSFAAGAMLYVVVEELIPEMSQGKHSNIGTIFFAVGFSVMMTLDVALG